MIKQFKLIIEHRFLIWLEIVVVLVPLLVFIVGMIIPLFFLIGLRPEVGIPVTLCVIAGVYSLSKMSVVLTGNKGEKITKWIGVFYTCGVLVVFPAIFSSPFPINVLFFLPIIVGAHWLYLVWGLRNA